MSSCIDAIVTDVTDRVRVQTSVGNKQIIPTLLASESSPMTMTLTHCNTGVTSVIDAEEKTVIMTCGMICEHERAYLECYPEAMIFFTGEEFEYFDVSSNIKWGIKH